MFASLVIIDILSLVFLKERKKREKMRKKSEIVTDSGKKLRVLWNFFSSVSREISALNNLSVQYDE